MEHDQHAYVTIKELCDCNWWSRMKANSGAFWMEKDPWWRGNTPRLTRYYRDGTYHTYFFQDHPDTNRSYMEFFYTQLLGFNNTVAALAHECIVVLALSLLVRVYMSVALKGVTPAWYLRRSNLSCLIASE